MKKLHLLIILFCITLVGLSCAQSNVSRGKAEELTGRKYAQLARGGILYDNWMEELNIRTEGTHPSYPAEGKKNDASTWRCKECHGWDYKGKSGAYSSGSHYTGIIGIGAYVDGNPEEIKKIIMNDTHAFGSMMPDSAAEALALFVAYGQIDMDLYIDRATKKSSGDAVNGGKIYIASCTKCHGEDGKEINFKTAQKPEYIGTLANTNPWESLHKIRWGNPGTQMLALFFTDIKDQVDVLSFSQTLPDK